MPNKVFIFMLLRKIPLTNQNVGFFNQSISCTNERTFEKGRNRPLISGRYGQSCLAVAEICDALRDFVPFVQFRKREKHTWRSVNFRVQLQASACNFTLKLTLLHVCFSRFLNCTNDIKSRNASHMEMMG